MKTPLFALAALTVLAPLARAGAAGPVAPAPAPLMDFSTAGYGGGGVALPTVAAKYSVAPTGGDDTRAIQAALDAVAKLQLDANGFRGAVALRPGTYKIAGQLKLNASGVVLRGNDSTLIATGDGRRTLIDIRGTTTSRTVGNPIKVTNETVAAGSNKLTLESTEGLAPGSRVVARRPSTREWITSIDANNFPGPGQYKDSRLEWAPGSRDIEWERTLTAVDAAAKVVTLDAPITTALETKFGGGTVQVVAWPDRLRNVGVENLTCVSEVNPGQPVEEEHAWMCVSVENAENVWVRRVTARQFVSSAVWVGNGARAVTVEDCASVQPVSELGGWRRVSFYVDGQQVLVQRCRAEDGIRDFAAGHCVAGPVVFLDCVALRTNGDSGPFESWASGVLYDRVTVQGGGLLFINLGARTQGAAWTSANCVAWNCSASSVIRAENPPGATNRIAVDEAKSSLYQTQVKARLGDQATPALAAVAALRDPANVPAAPAAAAPIPPVIRPVAITGGYFVVGGRAIFGGSMNSSLWRGQMLSGRGDTSTSPTRWAPGRIGTGATEDLGALTDRMAAQRAPFYYAFPGLWYDRRRDDHSVARRDDAEVYAPFFEGPWARSGQGKAWDGLSKYDLTKFNPWYFARLKELADECAAKGLVFVYQVYDNHNVQEAAGHWAEYAWRPANNLNDTGFPEPPVWENATQSRHHIADLFYDVSYAPRRELHLLHIRHTLDVLGDSPNVVITLGYQFAGPLPFQQFFVDTVADWSKAHGKRVRLMLQTSKPVTDAILADPVRGPLVDIVDARYWQYLENGELFAPDGLGQLAFREIRNNTFGREIAVPTKAEFVYRLVREYRDKYPAKAVIAGHGGFGPIPVLMAGGASPVSGEGSVGQAGPRRDDAAFTRFANERLSDILPKMKPVDGLATDAWCLADEGNAWLFYSPAGPSLQLTRAVATNLNSSWFNPRSGEITPATLGDGKTIAKPSAEAWVLLVRK